MARTVTRYFARGNTAQGRVNLFGSAFRGLRELYVLNGIAGLNKSALIQRISNHIQEKQLDVQLFHCPSDVDSLDGLVITDLQIGIIDGSVCGNSLDNLHGTNITYKDTDSAIDQDALSAYLGRISELEQQIRKAYSNAYETFGKALRVHDDWEKLYIQHMIFAKANRVTAEIVTSLFGERILPKQSKIRRLFLGAATPTGAVDFIPNITSGMLRRIFVKGRPGSGKSTMFKKIFKAAEERGFDVEVFHCGLDSNSLDMLIFPEISVAIFDSTAPHEHFPTLDTDEVLDMYQRAMDPNTDDWVAEPAGLVKARYTETIKKGTSYLADAKQLNDQLHSIYSAATNHDEVERLGMRLWEEIQLHIHSCKPPY